MARYCQGQANGALPGTVSTQGLVMIARDLPRPLKAPRLHKGDPACKLGAHVCRHLGQVLLGRPGDDNTMNHNPAFPWEGNTSSPLWQLTTQPGPGRVRSPPQRVPNENPPHHAAPRLAMN